MKQNKGEVGYTVVEVLIFIAISGAMFLSTFAAISGRRTTTEFNRAARDFELQIRDFANDVSTGYYPNVVNASGEYLRCSIAGNNVSLSYASGDNQGSNEACTFAGRSIHFNPSGGTDEAYRTYFLVGKRLNSLGGNTTSISDARPRVANASFTSHPDNFYTVECVFYLTTAGTPIAGSPCQTAGRQNTDNFTFMTTFSPTDFLANGNGNGDTQVDLVVSNPSPASFTGRSTADVSTEINGYAASTSNYILNPVGGVYVCLSSKGGNQKALLRIGGQDNNAATTLNVNPGSCN